MLGVFACDALVAAQRGQVIEVEVFEGLHLREVGGADPLRHPRQVADHRGQAVWDRDQFSSRAWAATRPPRRRTAAHDPRSAPGPRPAARRGARRGELCAVRWSSVSLDEDREAIWLRRAIRKEQRPARRGRAQDPPATAPGARRPDPWCCVIITLVRSGAGGRDRTDRGARLQAGCSAHTMASTCNYRHALGLSNHSGHHYPDSNSCHKPCHDRRSRPATATVEVRARTLSRSGSPCCVSRLAVRGQ